MLCHRGTVKPLEILYHCFFISDLKNTHALCIYLHRNEWTIMYDDIKINFLVRPEIVYKKNEERIINWLSKIMKSQIKHACVRVMPFGRLCIFLLYIYIDKIEISVDQGWIT